MSSPPATSEGGSLGELKEVPTCREHLQKVDDRIPQNPMVDDAGIAPANSRLGILNCLYGRPRLMLALAGIFLAQVMGCLDADTAIVIAQIILP